ncbi:hypothetical protein SAMN05444678_104202 [Sphingomonas sp. YR710]|jgi:hypothetical protein|uniref:hypothetical protein n=1 Tax=Sphingomonas sp. YR710 TaxID=1882773 RepID=UPI000888B2A9|nr:hypothetical protein [Sphingomonas sp. YR710]SDC64777.1 hypothetical protein SAMN05444678_104202 [Sphingomonas sp. YR710]
MVEHQDDRELVDLAGEMIRQHGARALDHVMMLIKDAVRRDDDDAVLQLDRVMRYIERER